MELKEKYTGKLTRNSNRHFQSFQEKLTPQVVEEFLGDSLREIAAAKTLEDWKKAILRWNEIKSHIETHFEIIELAFHCHTEDAAIEKEERRLKEEVEPVFSRENARVREKILNSEFRGALQEQLGAQYFRVLKLQQDAFDPRNIQLETKLNKVLADYTKLTGGASFEVGGKKYPLSHYLKFSNSPDAKIRRESFRSHSGWFLNHREALEDFYERSIQLRDEMGRTLGHENYIPLAYQRMQRTDYGPPEVENLRKQILQVMVPLARKIRDRQAKALGTKQLSISDANYFPHWKTGALKVSIPEETRTALKIYRKLSPRLADHFQKMLDWNLIDVEARPGKAPGAFCTGFSDFRVPFVFLNSVGEASDVTTLLHESGHAFQSWESRNIELVEMRSPTLEACEVHSMGMEFLAFPFYEEFFSHEDAERFKERHLAESILLLPYIAMVDEFQHLVYGGKASGPEGRKKAWEELEEKYLPGIDFSEAPEWRQHRWKRQLHIFKAPFYYIDYAIAQIGAWQLWMQSLNDREGAIQNYLNLCRLGGTLPLKEFFAAGKLKLPFEEDVLEPLMKEILNIQPLF